MTLAENLPITAPEASCRAAYIRKVIAGMSGSYTNRGPMLNAIKESLTTALAAAQLTPMQLNDFTDAMVAELYRIDAR